MISVSLNVDLVAGKAFLAGGGGGEWETVALTAPSGNPNSSVVHINKALGLASFKFSWQNVDTPLPDPIVFSPAEPLFDSGTFELFIDSFRGSSGDTVFCQPVFRLKDGNITVTMGNSIKFSDGSIVAIHKLTIVNLRTEKTVYLPPSYWL